MSSASKMRGVAVIEVELANAVSRIALIEAALDRSLANLASAAKAVQS